MDGTVLLREVTTCKGLRIDREAGVIRGVRVLGSDSANGRTYAREAIEKAAVLYEGRPVNVDHPNVSDGHAGRRVADRIGWLESVKVERDGLTADLYYLKSDPRSEVLCEAAERRPELFGLSHNVEGRVARRGGKTFVEEIVRVHSVDIVSDPATTRSLFESEETGMDPELDGVGPESSDPADAVKWGFRDAVNQILDTEEDKKAKLSKIKALLDAEEKAMSALSGKADDKPAEDKPPEDKPALESVDAMRARIVELESEGKARRLVEAKGLKAEPILLKAIAALSSEADRESLVENWASSHDDDRPRSGHSLRESAGVGGEPKTAKEFADSITGR